MFERFRNALDGFYTKERLQYKTLVSAIDTAFDSFYQVEDTDALLAETGKTRQQLLNAVLADDEVISCREDIETAIKAKKWRVWGEEVDEDTINRFYKIIQTHLDDFVAIAMLAMLNGYAVAVYRYTKDADGFMWIDKVLNKDGELDLYEPKRDGTLIFNDRSNSGNMLKLDNDWLKAKFLLLTHKAVPARPKGELTIIQAYPAVAIRKKNWAYAGQFIARYAQPYVVGKNGGFSNDNNKKFTTILHSFVRGGAVGISKDDSVDVHQLSGNGEAFETFERLANRKIQKLILGRVKNSEMTNGSRAAQQTDDQVRNDRVTAYLTLVIKAVQHALDAMLLVNKNYGAAIYAPQGLWFDYPEVKKTNVDQAKVDKMYADTGQIRFTKQYMLDVGYEESHFVMVEPENITPNPNQTNFDEPKPLAQQFSKKKATERPLTANDEKERQLMQSKIEALDALLQDSSGYDDFESKLSQLSAQYDNSELINDLAGACAQSYLEGMKGEQHQFYDEDV